MQIDLTRFRDVFLEEAVEHLEALEAGLLRLEREAGDTGLLDQVFRAAHSIKGSAGMFGFTDVARFTHGMETLLDRVRDGRTHATPAVVDLLLRARDVLAQLVDAARREGEAPAEAWTLLAELERAGAPALEGDAWGLFEPLIETAGAAAATWRVSIRPGPEMLRAGADPLLLLRDLAELGTLAQVTLDDSALPDLDALDPERCCLSWHVDLETEASPAAIREVFGFVEDVCAVEIEEARGAGRGARGAPASPDTASLDRSHDDAVPPDARAPRTPHPAPPVERRSGYDRRTGQHIDATSIRVATEKVDDLINLVGELVISQSMVTQLVAGLDAAQHAQLEEAVATLERNVRDLQERVMSIRMLPVGHLFARFPRMVRDTAAALGKQVALELVGEETELDKGVIERLGDPLTHLVRNAVDHGIEDAAARRAACKPEQAVVRLAAFHEGGSVIIEIADDGKGLDAERIRAKAVAQGLVAEDEVLTIEQTHQLIFRAGFSTAEQVSDLSGRGVGLDVVRRNVESLNGTVSITSTPGAGTTFRIKLPLTLAILDGMQLRVGAQVYVLPLLAIVESFRPTPADVKTVLGAGEVVMVRGEALPLHRLHALLGVSGAEMDPTRGLVLVLERDGARVGLLVDELLGQAQVVIKSLESNFRRVEGVTGATIMGDGRVALILDVDGLARLAAATSTSITGQAAA
ncbi:MAG TPA: chemotaxis protein CheA [Gemmatimonadaceae bacterium]|nr:chemotaxis protein CheA [Gemmatimonadaceae bacterium]